MFYYIEGTVALLDVGLAVIDCGGVGYALNTTTNSLSRLRVGERARMYVYTVIREDCFDLYGFFTLEEKRSFEMLVGVSGVGPKVAQAILSSNTPDALALAIVSGNEKALTSVPGIGKKIAQRILHGKLRTGFRNRGRRSGGRGQTGGRGGGAGRSGIRKRRDRRGSQGAGSAESDGGGDHPPGAAQYGQVRRDDVGYQLFGSGGG